MLLGLGQIRFLLSYGFLSCMKQVPQVSLKSLLFFSFCVATIKENVVISSNNY